MSGIELIRKFQGNEENIKYLLSKLEIAEKALDSAKKEIGLIVIHDKESSKRRFAAEEVIEEALQQIRE